MRSSLPTASAGSRSLRLGYVLAVACAHRMPTGLGVYRADQIAADLPAHAWQRICAGAGAKGHRYYDWAFITLPLAADQLAGHHWLPIRRNRATGELAFYRCWSPGPFALHQLVTVAGRRWSIEESLQAAKTGLGLDQHQHRRWKAWHRWTTLVIAAHAFLAAAATVSSTSPDALIDITVNEVRRLFHALILEPARRVCDIIAWSIFRRRHQDAAKTSHYARQALTEPGNGSPAGVLVGLCWVGTSWWQCGQNPSQVASWYCRCRRTA